MKGFSMIRNMAVCLACLGVVFPNLNVMADGGQKTTPAAKTTAIDVALQNDGTLVGKVINAEGVGLDGAVVTLTQGQKKVAEAVSDKAGNFTVKNLKGGTYHVASASGHANYRVWAPKTAPPSAQKHAIIVSGAQVVRGQFGGLDIITLTLLGTSITAVTLSAINLAETNDIKNEVEQLSP